MRAAVIGAGSMGKVHLRAYLSIPQVTELFLCDVNTLALEKVREEFPTVKAYADAKKLFEKEKLDIVSIVTTGPSHAFLTTLAAQHKIPRILCEKPISTSAKAAEEMMRVCTENGSNLTINHSRRWFEPYKELAALLKNGIIGDVKTIHMVLGGGRLGCMGTHLFDLMHMLSSKKSLSVFGKIDERYAGDHKGRAVFDPGGYVLVELEDNAKAFIDISEDLGLPLQIKITGSMGYIDIDEKRKYCAIFARSDEDKEKRLGQYSLPLESKKAPKFIELSLLDLTRKALYDFIEDKGSVCGGEDGLHALEITLAAHLSSKQGRKVTLPLSDTEFSVNIT